MEKSAPTPAGREASLHQPSENGIARSKEDVLKHHQDDETPAASEAEDAAIKGGRAVLLIAVATSAQMITQLQVGGSLFQAAPIGRALGTEEPGELAWTAASFALTAGIFVLFFGRCGDIYGHKVFFLFGWFLTAVFNLATGFTSTIIPFCILRALAGIGGASMVVNAVALLGRAFPAGSKLRMVSFCIFGALAPIGAVIGGTMDGLLLEKADYRWCFWVLTCVCVLVFGVAWFVIPNDKDDGGQMDWVGAGLGLSGMILFNFAWNQAPLAGWSSPYIYVLLVVSILLVAAFCFWQKRQGDAALLPARMFHSKEVPLVLVSLVFGWASFGIFLWYTAAFIRDIRGYEQPLSVMAQLAPLLPMGAGAALLLIPLTPRLAGHRIFAIAMGCFCLGNLLVSLAPVHQTYWAMVFPAIVLVPFGPDFSFASGQLIISNSVPRADQGSAGGLCMTITNYSISIGLGMAGTIERYVGNNGEDVLAGIRAALYFGASLAFVALLIVLCFVRIEHKPHGH